jgi:radical SAM protein with 4Fe4S-binding SPASM domain
MNRNLQDGLRLLSKITAARVLNAARVLLSYYVSRLLKKPIQWGLPISISIEPTTSCNLRCPQCPSGLRQFSRATGMLEHDTVKKVIDELEATLSYITFYFQGEPYLNKNFLDYVAYASSKRIYTATSTNAHFLDEATARQTVASGLDRLIISIDGTDQETYTQYRVGGKLDKVLAGTAQIMKWKKELRSATPHVIWQFIAFKHNEHQISEVKKLGKSYGVDEVAIKTAQVYDYENGHALIPANDKYSRYRASAAGFQLKNKLLNHCWRLWHACVITWDGKVVPCCFDKDASHTLGTLETSSFRSVWFNQNYVNFRSAVLRSRSEVDICTNCSEGSSVWA